MSSKVRALPFRYLEPAFFGGLLDDPLLFLRIRPLRRALLFDCGQINHLSKRVVKPIDTVFITHAHMDHCMGIPTLVRHHHASPKPLELFGPPGIAERIHHQLQGYDWNLAEPDWFTLHVHEIHQEHVQRYSFSGPERFRRRYHGSRVRKGREIWSCPYVSVEAELLDHKLPVLAFRIQELPPFNIDPELLKQHGFLPGNWIRDLKGSVWNHTGQQVFARTQDADGLPRTTLLKKPDNVYAIIKGASACASIGYLCDVGWTEENRSKIQAFFDGLTLLCAECTFLSVDLAKARATYHLCSDDLNQLVTFIRPRWLLPMHLSKSYLQRFCDLYTELVPAGETTILKLPQHIVPAPLLEKDVTSWLKTDIHSLH